MARNTRTSARFLGRDWRNEWSENLRAIGQHPGFSPSNAWIPEPPFWIEKLGFSALYAKKALAFQQCEVQNKFKHGLARISVPRGTRKAEFESGMRMHAEVSIRETAAVFVKFIVIKWVEILLMLAGVTTICFFLNASVSNLIAAGALSLLALLVIDTILNLISNVSPSAIYVIFRTALTICVGSWAGAELCSGRTFNGNPWVIGSLLALVGLGIGSATAVLTGVIWSLRWRHFFSNGALDDSLLTHLMNISHHINAHKETWGNPEFQQSVGTSISAIASQIERHLPGRLAIIGVTNREERKFLAVGAGKGVRLHLASLLRSDGQRGLRAMVNSYSTLIYRGAWLELPQAPVEHSASLTKIVKPLVASVLPAAVMVCLRETAIVSGNNETYGWLFSSLWFVISVGTWIDPSLAERLKLMGVMMSIFKRGEDSESDKE